MTGAHSDFRAKRGIAICSILFVVLCVVAGEWITPLRFGQDVRVYTFLVVLVVMAGLFTHRAQKESVADLGLRLDNFMRAARWLVLPTAVIAVGLLLFGWITGSLAAPPVRSSWHLRTAAWLLWWAFLQQYGLQAIINRQAQILWGKGIRSVIPVALIFAALHLPNPPLVAATLVVGLFWASVYQRAPNIFALALSHWLIVLVLISTLPPSVLHGMRVGSGYFDHPQTFSDPRPR
jgi:membrane protease YdiL (CAAX protease family)